MTQETVQHTIWHDGATFRYGDRKYHVCTHYHDPETNEHVYLLRFWSQRHQYWHYVAWDQSTIDWNERTGLLRYIANK